MPIFPHAKSISGASSCLALAHYILCRINTGEPLNLSDAGIYEASATGSQGCGEDLPYDSFESVSMEFQVWYAQDQVDLSHVFDSLVAAAKTLRTNWQGGDAGKERLLLSLESLAKGQSTDFGEQSLRAVERHLGAD